MYKTEKFLDYLCSCEFVCEVKEVEAAAEENEEAPAVYASYRAKVNFSPFLKGQTKIQGWFPLEATSGPPKDGIPSPGQSNSENATENASESEEAPAIPVASKPVAPPEVFISLKLSSPLLTSQEIQEATIVTVDIIRLDGLPGEWEEDYEQLLEAKERFDVGDAAAKAKGGGKKAPPPKKKVGKGEPAEYDSMDKPLFSFGFDVPIDSQHVSTIKHSTNSLNSLPVPEKAQDEDAPADGADGAEAPEQELRPPRFVDWSFSRQCYMTKPALQAFHHTIKSAIPFTVNVARDLQPSHDDLEAVPVPLVPGIVGQASINLSKLLREGQTTVEGQYPVRLTPEQLQALTSAREQEEEDEAKKSEEAKSKKKPGKGAEDEVVVEKKGALDIFEESCCMVTVRISLSKPIFPVLTEPRRMPKDVIEIRKPSITPMLGAAEEFDDEVRKSLEVLADMFVSVAESGWDEETRLQRTRELMYHVNRSGTYYRIKEQLKPSIARIYREMMLESGSSEKDLHVSLTKLHGRLTDQLVLKLNSLTQQPTPLSSQPRMSTAPKGNLSTTVHITALGSFGPARLKVLADEAELSGNLQTAEDYHKRRVLLPNPGADSFEERERAWKPKESAGSWYDYAMFCLRTGNPKQAGENLREAISINPKHQPSLLAYGMYLLSEGNRDTAEVFVRSLTDLQPGNYLVRVLEGLFLEECEEIALSIEAYDLAKTLHTAYHGEYASAEEEKEALSGSRQAIDQLLDVLNNNFIIYEPVTTADLPSDQLFVHAARYLLSLGFAELAGKLLNKASEDSGETAWLLIQRGLLHRLTKDVEQAKECLKAAGGMGRDQGEVIEAFSSLGHVLFEANRVQEAKDAYTLWTEWEPTKMDKLALLRLAHIYASQDQHEEALELFLQLCQSFPSCKSFLGAGRALVELKRFEEAEKALSEANKCDPTCAEVWGVLVVVELTLEKFLEARRCFKW